RRRCRALLSRSVALAPAQRRASARRAAPFAAPHRERPTRLPARRATPRESGRDRARGPRSAAGRLELMRAVRAESMTADAIRAPTRGCRVLVLVPGGARAPGPVSG